LNEEPQWYYDEDYCLLYLKITPYRYVEEVSFIRILD